MIATHDRGQDVRKQEVLQRVPLNPGALIIDPLNHTNEPFWIGKRGTPLRVGKHLHGDEHFDEVLELPPPIGIERLPRPHQPRVQGGSQIQRQTCCPVGEPENALHNLTFTAPTHRVRASDQQMNEKQLRGQLNRRDGRPIQLAPQLRDEIVGADDGVLHEVPHQLLPIRHSRPGAVLEQCPVLKQASVAPQRRGGIYGLRGRIRDTRN